MKTRQLRTSRTETHTMVWEETTLGKRYWMVARREYIDSNRAKALLRNQVGVQRNISHAKASSFVQAIHKGEWIESLAAIYISDTGKLLDGQHRLTAIVDSGQGMFCIVISGHPENTASYFDQGRPRSLENVIKGQGLPNAKEMAATVKMLYRLYDNTSTPPRNEVGKRIAEDNPDLQDAVATAIRMKEDAHIAVPVLAGTYFILSSHYGKESVEEFFKELTNGGPSREDRNHPITRLFTTVREEWMKLQVGSDTRALLGGPKQSGGLPGSNNSQPAMRYILIAWISESFDAWMGGSKRLRKMCAIEEVAKYTDAFTEKLRQHLNVRKSYQDEIEDILEEAEDLPF